MLLRFFTALIVKSGCSIDVLTFRVYNEIMEIMPKIPLEFITGEVFGNVYISKKATGDSTAQ